MSRGSGPPLISHYTILEKLGEGGMGVVYKAEDLKLQRKVALKFLPPELARDSIAKERLLREARAASQLDHPNIGTIHEIDETREGQPFIAMTYYEGETLRERIERGPLQLDQAIQIATQVAASLASAHEKGIVHRDIKPSNIMVSSKDQVKILDFGLAKITGAITLTDSNTTMGTNRYMSPEQTQGASVDHRSDIFSFGVVLYEMLTSQHPFKGDYDQAVVYSIMEEDPEPITALRTGVPLALESIVAKAMAKDSKHRYQHVDEISVDLGSIERTSRRLSIASQPSTLHSRFPTKWSSLLIIVGLFAVMVIGVLLWEWFRSFHEENPAVIRFTVPLKSSGQIMGRLGGIVSISPDGKTLVYPGTAENGTQLFQHQLHKLEATPIPGTAGEVSESGPVFSPDGKWLAYTQGKGLAFAQAKEELMRIPVDGGLPTTICELPGFCVGMSWGSGDRILYPETHGGTSMISGLSSVSAFGGAPEVVTKPEEVESGQHRHRFPSFLPGGDAALFTIWTGSIREAHVGVVSLKTGETKSLFKGMSPRYAPTGHLLYVQENGYLMAVPFDATKLEVKGAPVAVVKDVTVQISGSAKYSFSDNGTLVYLPTGYQKRALVQVDRQDNTLYLTDDRQNFLNPRFSPDGKHVAVCIGSAIKEIWNYDIQEGSKIRIAEGTRGAIIPVWSPDGQYIAYSSQKYGTFDIFSKNADGTGEVEELLVAEGTQIPCSWSADGDYLIFSEQGDLYTLSLNQPYERRALIKTPFNEDMAAPSPDGRWLAYTSDESGQIDVYVTEFPSPQKRQLISVDGGNEPIWSKDSKKLFYRTAEHLMAVTFETEPAFKITKRTTVLEITDFEPVGGIFGGAPNYDVFPDGERFLMIRKPETPPYVVVVVNWFEELKRKVPM